MKATTLKSALLRSAQTVAVFAICVAATFVATREAFAKSGSVNQLKVIDSGIEALQWRLNMIKNA